MVLRKDQRARLAVKGNYSVPFQGPAAPLRIHNGIMFPFTPNISVSHQVEYVPYETVHSNYQQNSYSKTRTPAIQITGAFTASTVDEAAYLVGVMHFLRVVTKMNFGSDPEAGTPPPVLLFSAYGTYNFHNVPVVVGSFNFIYEDGVDYVEVSTNGETVQVPSMMTIAMDLLPQYQPALQNKFSMNEFASGRGYKDGFL